MRVLTTYHVGYYLNRRASWYRIMHFTTPISLVQWLQVNASTIESIDFVSETTIEN